MAAPTHICPLTPVALDITDSKNAQILSPRCHLFMTVFWRWSHACAWRKMHVYRSYWVRLGLILRNLSIIFLLWFTFNFPQNTVMNRWHLVYKICAFLEPAMSSVWVTATGMRMKLLGRRRPRTQFRGDNFCMVFALWRYFWRSIWSGKVV